MTATALRVEEAAAPYLVAPPLTDHLDTFASAPEGFKRLRELVLNLAVRGSLVPQEPSDEPAAMLLDRIKAEKAKLNSRLRSSGEQPEAPYALPAGWAWTSLGEAGITNPRNEASDDTETAFVPMAMIPAALGVPHTQEVRNWQDIKNGFTHFADNDVGVAKITPCFENGKSCVFRNLKNSLGAGTTELHVFRPVGNTVLPDYVLIYLKNPSFLKEGERVMTGSAGQKRLPRSFFENNPFPLPPLAEQSRIVAKVEELMALIDALEAKVGAGETARGKLLDALLAALADSPDAAATAEAWAQLAPHFDLLLQTPADVDRLQQTLLTLAVKGRLVPQDPKDEPAAELLKRIRAEKERLVAEGKIKRDKSLPEVGEIEYAYEVPQNWERVRLADFALELCTGPFGSALHKQDYVSGGIPLVNPSHLRNGVIQPEREVSVTSETSDRLSGYRLSKGDIVLARRGEVGRCAIVTAKEEGWLCGTGSFFLKLPTIANRDFLYLLFQSPDTRNYLSEGAVGATMVNLNQRILVMMPIGLPPAAEQSRIVTAVASLTALCNRLRARLATRRALSAKLAASLTESAIA